MINALNETRDYLVARGIGQPFCGIILGTGLGRLANQIETELTLDYAEIPHFPLSTVEFHAGKLIYGRLSGKKVLAMQGRFHQYEGYDFAQITYPVRVMKLLGIKYLLVSNAGGALNPAYRKGELMLLDDHINLLPGNPLTGRNIDELGPRYPDMSRPYSAFLNERIEKIAAEEGIMLHKRVYAAVAGPNLETRAEYRYIRMIGADVVGMSTVPEVIVANHMGLPCAAVSVLTDECNPDDLKPVDIQEIIAVAGMAEKPLTRLFVRLIETL